MEIFRVLGNNCLMSIDKHGREIILMGRGIGFKKKKGDFVEICKISSFFIAMPSDKNIRSISH